MKIKKFGELTYLKSVVLSWSGISLLGILAAAFFFRIYGINFGLPYIYHPDERSIVDRALRMLRTRDFSPQLAGFYLWGRFATVLLGTMTVALTYWVGKKVFSKKVCLLGALFLAFSSEHVQYSHYITTDVPVAFFALVTFLFCPFAAWPLLLLGVMKKDS